MTSSSAKITFDLATYAKCVLHVDVFDFDFLAVVQMICKHVREVGCFFRSSIFVLCVVSSVLNW